jgi:hypothetical protein
VETIAVATPLLSMSSTALAGVHSSSGRWFVFLAEMAAMNPGAEKWWCVSIRYGISGGGAEACALRKQLGNAAAAPSAAAPAMNSRLAMEVENRGTIFFMASVWISLFFGR